MKKFSTAALLFALACSGSQAASAICEFQTQAPDSHVVLAGDTLWDISERFLKTPWCWPQVWQENRQQIHDPHWIYPGQTIYLDRQRGRLTLQNPAQIQNQQWSPRVRSAALPGTPIAVIPEHLLRLIAQAPVLLRSQLSALPMIAGFTDGRSMAGKNDVVFVQGPLGGHSAFSVIRPQQIVSDPDSGEKLAESGLRIGTLQLQEAAVHHSEPHRFTVSASNTELQRGDLLLPLEPATALTLPPPHPAAALSGRIAGIVRGSIWAGQYDIVSINRGSLAGLDAGSVLTAMKHVKISAHDQDRYTPPAYAEQAIATLLVFDVAERVAFAMVMQTTDGLAAGDHIGSVSAAMPASVPTSTPSAAR